MGFIDFIRRDLHILETSRERNKAAAAAHFPSTDIDGKSRSLINLDAGADEID